MATPKIHRRSLGFSLVEILLAMVIMSIALLGILALQTSSVRSAAGSRGRETAVYLCQTLLDNVQTEAQRLNLATGYLIPGAGSSATTYFGAGASGNLYFDINGKSVPVSSTDKVFTIAWSRKVPRDAAPKCYEFSAVATWSFETNASNAPIVKTVQIGRLVRTDA